MTIKECIDIVDNAKPNQYSVKDKVAWLSFIDEIIINDVLKTHEGYDKRYDDFKGYTEDKLSVPLIVKNPYDRLYVAYLKMMIDKENGETARYNNSATTYNTYLLEFKKYYNKTHLPLSNVRIPTKKATGASDKDISEAQLESLKNVVYALLRDDLDDIISDDKLYDIVMKYVLNNADMLKGKDGKDGADGKDGVTGKSLTYKDLTEAEKADFLKDVYTRYFIDNSIKALEDKIEDGKTIAKEDLERFRQSIYTDLESKASVKFVRDTLETKAMEIRDVTNGLLSSKADKVYTKEEVDGKIYVISSEVGNRYTKEEVDNKLSEIGGSVDAYTKAEIDEKLKNPSYEEQVKLTGITTATPGHEYAMVEINDNSVSSDWCTFDIDIHGEVRFTCECTESRVGINIDGKFITDIGVDSESGATEYTFEGVIKNGMSINCSMATAVFTEFVKKVYVKDVISDINGKIGDIDVALDELHNYATSLIGGEA
jgi:hypothetical protein